MMPPSRRDISLILSIRIISKLTVSGYHGALGKMFLVTALEEQFPKEGDGAAESFGQSTHVVVAPTNHSVARHLGESPGKCLGCLGSPSHATQRDSGLYTAWFEAWEVEVIL